MSFFLSWISASLYALRASRKGYSFAMDIQDYTAFSQAFPFEETIDQAGAIAATINDMKSPKPMDRLICGDVGFGKTEVALRAALLLCRTTVRWRYWYRQPCWPSNTSTPLATGLRITR